VLVYAARVFTVAGDKTSAVETLKKAVALGYSTQEINQEPDFIPLHLEPEYQKLVKR
jgi:hypothetical protein